MLRDVLCSFPGVGSWPCDEINYVWRHGNARWPTDAFSPGQARPKVRAFIRGSFDRLAKKDGLDVVVEKTCANSLRVGFVNAVVPEAQFIHIVRDGRDVAVSAAERWAAPLDLPYVLKKARFVPLRDLPYYGLRYAWNRVHRVLSTDEHLAFWGPRFPGMGDVLRRHRLPVACAVQWRECVDAATRDLALIDEARVHAVRYEDFVAHPVEHVQGLLDFLGISVASHEAEAAVQDVSPRSVGRWRKVLDDETYREVLAKIESTLKQFSYDV